MKTYAIHGLMLGLLTAFASVAVADDHKPEAEKRAEAAKEKAEIDRMATQGLQQLFESTPEARTLHEQAYGYAIFQNLKVAVGLTGAGGKGVAVAKPAEKRTYMKMAVGGIGLELGGQQYNVLFLFENEDTYNNFLYRGWNAEASAKAVIGETGATTAHSFTDGMAIYQFNQKGLLAGADIAISRVWIDEDLSPEAAAKREKMKEEKSREKDKDQHTEPTP